jgi:hypothetical protein
LSLLLNKNDEDDVDNDSDVVGSTVVELTTMYASAK